MFQRVEFSEEEEVILDSIWFEMSIEQARKEAKAKEERPEYWAREDTDIAEAIFLYLGIAPDASDEEIARARKHANLVAEILRDRDEAEPNG